MTARRATPGSADFRVIADGKTLFKSGVMKPGVAPKTVDVDLRGAKLLLLCVDPAGDGINNDHADWADAKFIVTGVKPRAVDGPHEEAVILTPKPSPKPHINGPAVYGCRPGKSLHLPHSHHRPAADQFHGRKSAGRT